MQAQQFSSQPAVVARQKYRDEEHSPKGAMGTNIMHDRRVVRGNTYAALVVPEDHPAEIAKHREAQRRRLQKANQQGMRPSTPEPVPGRAHMDVQTDVYLEELTGRTTEFEAETQTDAALERHDEPLWMPASSGLDIATQIEEGDLFDFDTEVQPILEVLVGKTLERAAMEVMEDEELAAMRKHQEHFQQLREQELIEVQRMEAAEQRRQEEKERRKEQTRARKQCDEAVQRKILSRNVSRSYLSGLTARCFEELYDAGVFYDGDLIGTEGLFMPWLLDSVTEQFNTFHRNEKLLGQSILDMVKDRQNHHHKVLTKYEDQLDEIEAAERRVRMEVDEERRISNLEKERIAAEVNAMKEGENEDWINTYQVTAFEEGVVTLDDESADTSVPAELAEEFGTKWSAFTKEPEEGEEAAKVPIYVSVNKTKKVIVAFAEPPAAPAEEAGE